ncbi:S8 family serine peptidase [Luteimonas sp. FCS-9]|uniref:S8 family serine peptidase n=1 Tax=Luteimonas sp. FCS-9 TaxID=1547516 RepID=UPI00063EBD92|nr:S8 family serine peptidase [Luteimonas sp. FCS-9]KLJ00798.1 protease [Luteimonas sp. FCS-9]
MHTNKSLGLAAGAALAMAISQSLWAAPPVGRSLVEAPAAPQATTQLIVKYRTPAARTLSVATAADRAGVVERGLAGVAGNRPLTAQALRRSATGADVVRLSRRLEAAELGRLLTELRQDPAVEYAEPDQVLHPVGMLTRPSAAAAPAEVVPDDPLYATYQWHLHGEAGGIRAPAAWESSTGAGTVVAVIDTGILPGHPDLQDGDHVLEGYDFISSAFYSRRPTDERVPGALDHGDWREATNECNLPAAPSSWHGTHVAGTVGQLTHNALGGAGVAYDAQVLPVRVLGYCGGQMSDIADAIVWASGGSVDGVPDNAHPAEVINLSLGGSGTCSATMQGAIDTAVANGSTVVVAAGNSAANTSGFTPANCANVVTVGATRITGGIAYYSNFGAAVDIAGPGGGEQEDPGNAGWDGFVVQAGYSGETGPSGGEYVNTGKAGTSMAAPHVAATAALVQSALAAAGKPVLSPADMEVLLKRTSRPFPVPPSAVRPIGTGIVDASLALARALEEPCDPAVDDCTATALPLANGVPRTGLADDDAREALYAFEARAGATLSFLTLAGTGNVRLYVKRDGVPTEHDYDARSVRAGTAHTVRFTAPQAGTYYIKLVGGTRGYSGVTLIGRQ